MTGTEDLERRPTALVIVESMFGNTEQVGRAVASGLADGGVDAVVVDVAAAPVDLPAHLDLVVLGAPTHAFSLSRPSTRADAVRQGAPPERAASGLREWLGAVLPQDPRRCPVAAVFDTRVSKVRRLPAAAGPRAVRIARRRGLRVLGRPRRSSCPASAARWSMASSSGPRRGATPWRVS